MGSGALRGLLASAALGLASVGVGGLFAGPPPTRRIEITASRYEFEPRRIEVREGDVVDLALRSADTDHGLAIKAFGVKVAIPKGGETVGVSFVASRVGIFPVECSEYCGSGHKRMRGELVVTERAR